MDNKKDSSPLDDKKVAEGAATTSNSQGDNKQSDKDKSSPPKADAHPDKVAEGAAPAYNQSVNKRSDTDISQPEDEMERFATKGDVKSAKDEITGIMNVKFDATHEKMDTNFDATHEKMDTNFDATHEKMDTKFATKEDFSTFKIEIIRQFARIQNLILVGIIIFLLNLTGLFEYLRNLLPFLP